MGKWNSSKIEELCYVGRGRVISQFDLEDNADYPVYSSQTSNDGIMGYLSTFDFDGEYVTWTTDGANAGTVFHRIGKFNCTNVCGTLLSKGQVYPLFLSKQLGFIAKRHVSYVGNPKLMNNIMAKIEIEYPTDINEQKKISRVLTTVDSAIAKTNSIIKKYEAIKEGLLQDLLSNGIDENGVIRSQKTHEYKDSPLGKIPVEWDSVPILHLGTVSGGSTPKTNDASNWGETHVWITPNDLSNISGKYIFSSERKITDKGLNQATRQLLPPNSFIISCRAPVGYCAVVKVPFSHNQGCKSIVPNELIISEYLYYSLVGKKASLERVSSGTTFLELPKKELESFLIAVPQEIKEQEAIISRLNSIDSKIEIEMRNLSKYQAIKNGLMQDLLTHKVSVDPLLERSVENE